MLPALHPADLDHPGAITAYMLEFSCTPITLNRSRYDVSSAFPLIDEIMVDFVFYRYLILCHANVCPPQSLHR